MTYQQRLDALRETKLRQTREKQEFLGPMDYDDWGIVLPPPELRVLRETHSGSGFPFRDVQIRGVRMESNHPSGSFFGPELCGGNFRTLLEAHPVYVDPASSLAGAARRRGIHRGIYADTARTHRTAGSLDNAGKGQCSCREAPGRRA